MKLFSLDIQRGAIIEHGDQCMARASCCGNRCFGSSQHVTLSFDLMHSKSEVDLFLLCGGIYDEENGNLNSSCLVIALLYNYIQGSRKYSKYSGNKLKVIHVIYILYGLRY